MEIEEWRPPPRIAPPPPPRKSRQGLTLTLFGVGAFLITLAVLNWHSLVEHAEQVGTAVNTPQPAPPGITTQSQTQPPQIPEEKSTASAAQTGTQQPRTDPSPFQ